MIKIGNLSPPLPGTRWFSRLIWIILLSGSAAAGEGRADDIRVYASVPQNEISLEDSLPLSVTVEGSQPSSSPELPPLKDFKIRSRGASSSLQIVNGVKTASTTYNYLLLPKSTGTFTLGAVRVTVNGKIYRTEPIPLTVKKQVSSGDAPAPVFVEAEISNTEPYVQEQVIFTLRVYHRVDIRNLGIDFEFSGFREEKRKGPQRITRQRNGYRYQVMEFHTALFPMRPGKVKISPGIVDLDIVEGPKGVTPFDPRNPFGQGSIFDNFFKTRHNQTVTLKVQPLPDRNRPQHFSNLVGEFKISSELSRKEMEAGDTVTLTVTVTGRGNLNDLALTLPDWGGDFKTYEDRSRFIPPTGGEAHSGSKVYTFALVPLRAGALQVPPVELTYFNPAQKDYLTLRTPAQVLQVQPGKESGQLEIKKSPSDEPFATRPSVRKLGEDILPIHTGPAIYENHRWHTRTGWLYGAGMVLPAVLFFIYSGIHQKRQRLKHDIAYARSHGAYPRALSQLEKLSGEQDPRERAKELSLIIREYLGNVLNLQGTAFTPAEVEEKLKAGNFSSEDIRAARDLLEQCESLQYSPSRGEATETLVKDSRNLLERLEKKP